MTSHEFQRQLRGVFTVLRTLVRQTKEGRHTVEDYAAHLESRIGALARVQEIVMRAPAEGVDLYELVCGELLAQVIPEDRFELNGPEVRVAPEAATALTLAFHELTVNALTHGAFSVPAGRVWIAWTIQSEPTGGKPAGLAFEWHEFGVELSDQAPSKKGFGCEVLERLLPYELSAHTTFKATREGVRVSLLIPAPAGGTVWRPASNIGDH